MAQHRIAANDVRRFAFTNLWDEGVLTRRRPAIPTGPVFLQQTIKTGLLAAISSLPDNDVNGEYFILLDVPVCGAEVGCSPRVLISHKKVAAPAPAEDVLQACSTFILPHNLVRALCCSSQLRARRAAGVDGGADARACGGRRALHLPR